MGKKFRNGMLILLAGMLTFGSGCGEQLADLTEDEENTIIAYASHIVSKYNKRQPDGICRVYLPDEEEEEPVEETPEEPQEETEEKAPEQEEPGDLPEEEEPVSPEYSGSEDVPEMDLVSILGLSGVTAQWTRTEVTSSYVSEDAMSIAPARGNAYVVLTIELSNPGAEPVNVDVLSLNPGFMLWANGREKIPYSLTILPTDFSTFVGTVEPGQTIETQLFFQRNIDKITEEDRYALDVTLNGNTGRVVKQ